MQKHFNKTAVTLKAVPYQIQSSHPTKIYLFKVSDRYSRKRCEIGSKLTIKTPERRQ